MNTTTTLTPIESTILSQQAEIQHEIEDIRTTLEKIRMALWMLTPTSNAENGEGEDNQ